MNTLIIVLLVINIFLTGRISMLLSKLLKTLAEIITENGGK